MSKNREYPDRPIVGVGVVVFRGDKILLVKRKKEPYKGQWSIPGGKQKIAETVYEAVERELFEETGLKVEKLKLLDFVDIIIPDSKGEAIFHYTILDFTAEWLSGECISKEEIESAKWFKPNMIDNLKLSKNTKEIIYKAIEKNRKKYKLDN